MYVSMLLSNRSLSIIFGRMFRKDGRANLVNERKKEEN